MKKWLILFFITSLPFQAFSIVSDKMLDYMEPRIAKVESNNNSVCIGDTNLVNKAYGHLQIRQVVCDDVEKDLGIRYRAEQMLGNRKLSRTVYRAYLKKLTKNIKVVTCEMVARMWNGGPRGMEKEKTMYYLYKFGDLNMVADATPSKTESSKIAKIEKTKTKAKHHVVVQTKVVKRLKKFATNNQVKSTKAARG